MKKIILFCAAVWLSHTVFAQNTIIGTVTDQNNLPLAGVTVYIPEMNKGTITQANGNYELTNLPQGKIKVQFSLLGYTNHIETLLLTGMTKQLNVMLRQTAIEIEEIVVSGGYNSSQHENAVKFDVLKLDPLTTTNSPNFMESLTKVPGVDMISKGSGVSKPLIRGLSMNDVLTLNNGVRFENYQYSSHHPLGIDEFGVEDVEIIKGPASLLYGSDAIGGVINFIKEKPAPINTIQGDYNLQLFSNTLGINNNLGIKCAGKNFFGGIRAGHKTHADFLQVGETYVPNSRFNEFSVKTNAGFTDKIGTFKLYYDFNNQKLGLTEDEAIEEITSRGRKNEIFFQEFNTHLLSSQNKTYLKKFKLDVNAAFQSTELSHIAEAGAYEIQMNLRTLTYDVKLHLPSDEFSEYIVGFQGLNQKNKNLNDRETILLPDAVTDNYSVFGLLQHTFFKKLKVQSGIRYDYKTISTSAVGVIEKPENYRKPLYKPFSSFTGSLGATYHVTEELLFRTNLAAAYRTPNLAELTSKGQHELRYEIGDENLVSENSLETDLSLHYHKKDFTFDLAGFHNLVGNYIFISPTGEKTPSGISIYKYKQQDSKLYGGEAGLHIHPTGMKWLHFETTFSSVIGKQRNGDYLPFIPAHKLRFELKAEKEKLGFMHNVFASVNTLTAFRQNNAAPDETTTAGYTLLDCTVGGQIKVNKQSVGWSIAAQNILDKKYIDHLSTLKETNFFNPGRNISLNIRVPFSIQ